MNETNAVSSQTLGKIALGLAILPWISAAAVYLIKPG